LHRRSRYDEFEQFLNWLLELIHAEAVDALLVSGDIFDTTVPSNRATELYYQFLGRLMNSSCRHVIITAGNHDSPSFLQAPKEVLRFLNVHVFASAESPEDEVLTLKDDAGATEMIVCAVPYLRDRDIRKSVSGESGEDKDQKMIEGIRAHYKAVCSIAENSLEKIVPKVPVVAMGHLFAAGGKTSDDDGVRELYVGSLARIRADIFPESISYVALGHLHIPQKVGDKNYIRYCGSPIPMGFGESKHQKLVLLVEFSGAELKHITETPVPCFQSLERIRGSLAVISDRIEELTTEKSRSWLEVVYDGEELIGNLREKIDSMIDGSGMDVLRIKNTRLVQRVLGSMKEDESLDDLDEEDVFARCLDAHEVPEGQRDSLMGDYRTVLLSLQEEDRKAE